MRRIEVKHTSEILRVGMAQIAPVWLDRGKTLKKIEAYVEMAKEQDCELLAFGEALVPGYPFWIERTDGARFNSPVQKEIHARYMRESVQIENGDLASICDTAKKHDMTVVLGCIERPSDRGGHSLYCAMVYIDSRGDIKSVHRKLMPTYEERLTWSPGDGNGLRVHTLDPFTVGGLNCWENWMPLPRAALYAQGEDLHIAIWPGGIHNTQDITRFISKESRSFVMSVSGFMRKEDFPPDTPYLNEIISEGPEIIANGGSCLAGPDGEWIIEPITDREALKVISIDHRRVREERQNFDPSGHYARPDVTRLIVNRKRQSTITIVE
jgi:nitrilase